jgi:hypothetical protein
LLGLLREANRIGWWYSVTDVLPGWFESFIGLETAAKLIRTYEIQFIPGLLQTEDYARAVIAQGNGRGGVSVETVDRRIGVRMSRQEILNRPDPPRLWAVVDEAAIRRRIGGPAVMRAQLKHLIAAMEQPNIVIQVIPFASGGHVAEGGAFSILRFPEPDVPDVVYLEHLTGAAYLERRDDVDRYEEVMNRLSVDSAPPDKSAQIFTGIIDEM